MANYYRAPHRYRRYYRHLQTLYKKPPVRDFTFLVLSLLTTAFFGFFAIKPSLKIIGGLVKEIKEERMVSEKLEKKINALSLAQREYTLVQPDLPIVHHVLPKKSDFSRLAKQTEYLASKNKAALLSLRIQRTSLFGKEAEELVPLEFSLNIGGEYRSLRGFLENLEKLDRLVTIESFCFSEKKKGGEEIEFPLYLGITARGYYLK